MIEIRQATQADLEYVKANPIDENVIKDFLDVKLSGWAKTALIDGKIVGVGGVVQYWPHVAEGWYCLSKEAAQYKTQMVKCIRKITEQAIKELDLHRIQSTIRVDFERAIKLAEFVGFKCEGKMAKYTADGFDAYIYAIVKE